MIPGMSLLTKTSGRSIAPVASTISRARTFHRRWRGVPAGTGRYPIGSGVAVNWPVGSGGRGSSGVAAIVSQTPGAIGYADIAYALANHLHYFAVKNRSGKYATPGLRGMLAAATSDQKPDANNAYSIVNPPAKFPLAYPIATYTYVIVPQQSAKAADLKKFLFWAVTKGQTFGPKLLFQPIPPSVCCTAAATPALPRWPEPTGQFTATPLPSADCHAGLTLER